MAPGTGRFKDVAFSAKLLENGAAREKIKVNKTPRGINGAHFIWSKYVIYISYFPCSLTICLSCPVKESLRDQSNVFATTIGIIDFCSKSQLSAVQSSEGHAQLEGISFFVANLKLNCLKAITPSRSTAINVAF